MRCRQQLQSAKLTRLIRLTTGEEAAGVAGEEVGGELELNSNGFSDICL
jgi:hypothetical protein